jgi:hypothetical protein
MTQTVPSDWQWTGMPRAIKWLVKERATGVRFPAETMFLPLLPCPDRIWSPSDSLLKAHGDSSHCRTALLHHNKKSMSYPSMFTSQNSSRRDISCRLRRKKIAGRNSHVRVSATSKARGSQGSESSRSFLSTRRPQRAY